MAFTIAQRVAPVDRFCGPAMWQIFDARGDECSTANAIPTFIVGDQPRKHAVGVASIDHDGGYVPVDSER